MIKISTREHIRSVKSTGYIRLKKENKSKNFEQFILSNKQKEMFKLYDRYEREDPFQDLDVIYDPNKIDEDSYGDHVGKITFVVKEYKDGSNSVKWFRIDNIWTLDEFKKLEFE